MHPHRSALLILWFAVLFAGCADRIEIEGPIPDREPSKAWSADLKEVATKNGIQFSTLQGQQENLNRFLAWASEHGQHSDTWKESKEDKRLVYLLNVHNAAVLHNLLRHDVPRIRVYGRLLQLPGSPELGIGPTS